MHIRNWFLVLFSLRVGCVFVALCFSVSEGLRIYLDLITFTVWCVAWSEVWEFFWIVCCPGCFSLIRFNVFARICACFVVFVNCYCVCLAQRMDFTGLVAARFAGSLVATTYVCVVLALF